ncbi:helix-turn-helix domain-containing protein [Lactococcus sp. DD01]|uniref:helix-turn-helix domain-containing protein n=1 Tax=Lactococcus sp. DD01 TaxID=1776443 RepID=UPI000776596E|nr:helix-turn-helix transcriptional regulator [Lactococcus sp. DD01]
MTKHSLFYERIKEISKKQNKSINQIERELGLPRNSLHNYKYDRIPSVKRVTELARYFGVSIDYLVGEEKESSVESVDVLFSRLNSYQKIALLKLLRNWFLDQQIAHIYFGFNNEQLEELEGDVELKNKSF